jgi:hypothetical protein
MYNYFACVSCYEDGDVVKIKVQSNNMPNVCWQHNPKNPNIAKTATVEFEVMWNKNFKKPTETTPPYYYNYNYYTDFYTKDDASFVLCDIQRTDSSNMLYEIGSSYSHADQDPANSVWNLATWAGFSKMNIAIFNGLALGDQDAVATEWETMDRCMTHATPVSNLLHVHSLSPCAAGSNTEDDTLGSTSSKPGICGGDNDCSTMDYWKTNWVKPNLG